MKNALDPYTKRAIRRPPDFRASINWIYFSSIGFTVVGGGLFAFLLQANFYEFNPETFEALIGSGLVGFMGLSGFFGARQSLNKPTAFYTEQAIQLNHSEFLGMNQKSTLIQLADVRSAQVGSENLVELYFEGGGYDEFNVYHERGFDRSATVDGNAVDVAEFLEMLKARKIPIT